MKDSNIIVSLICPCYNEQKYIAQCIDSIMQQDFPISQLEFLLIDGGSTDGTIDIIQNYQKQYPCLQLLHNPQRISPVAMNLGIRAAQGQYIVRIDAHSVFPSSYVSTLLHYLNTLPQAQNVGALCHTVPANDTLLARAIALASSHRFGVGNSLFRVGISSIQEVDTVPFGCWRKDWLLRVGGFDEELARNQDDELNARTIQQGGKIYLIPELSVEYFARPTLKKTWMMFYQYGLYKPIVNRKLRKPATIRQFIPPLFVIGCIPALPIYLPVLLVLCCANHNPWLFITFPTIHFGYGVGYWIGLFKMLTHSSIHIKSNH
ncbi:MAG: glycosyltransferase family 2 protein [Paludibacteraceae bacterium]|nr:glycosyltransferase family 2 protein [Paludibacteraceae bacterium]